MFYAKHITLQSLGGSLSFSIINCATFGRAPCLFFENITSIFLSGNDSLCCMLLVDKEACIASH